MTYTHAPHMERVSVCPVCFALVPDSKQDEHDEWHAGPQHTCGPFDLRGHCVECGEYPSMEIREALPPTGVSGIDQGRRDWDRRHGRG